MIQALIALERSDAVDIAAVLLANDEEPPSPATPTQELALAQARGLPRSWRCEWALTVLRDPENRTLVNKYLVAARLAQVRIAAQVWVCCDAEIRGRKSLLGRLVFPTAEIKIKIYGDRGMKLATDQDYESLKLQLHIGELTFGVEELLALKRGETLRCTLPQKLSATAHLMGAALAKAQISFVDGEVIVEITQLSSLSGDTQSTSH